MTVYASVRLDVTFAAGTDSTYVELRAKVLDAGPGHVELDVSFDGTAPLIQPSLQLVGQAPGTTVQVPGLTPAWRVDGLDPGASVVGPVEIGADLEACARKWTTTVYASIGSRPRGDLASGPLGYEIERGGPPPGRRVPVDFDLEIEGRGGFAGTSAALALLTSGYRLTSKRSYTSVAHLMTMEGAGPETLYQNVLVDLELAPNHGLRHGAIVVLLMQAAGIPDELIDVDPGLGAPRSVPVTLSCVALWPTIHAILRPIGYAVMAGREDGVFRAVTLDVDEVAVASLGALDIDLDGFEVDSDDTAPTCIEVEGKRLADDDAGGGAAGAVTSRVVVSTYEDGYVQPVAVAIQASGSSTITPTGAATPAPKDNVLVRRVTAEVTTEAGCEVLTYTRTEAWRNSRVARYIAANTPDGEPRVYPTSYNPKFFDTIPTADDAQEAFLWSTPRFLVESEIWQRPQWRADGRRIGTITQYGGWYNPPRAIKSGGSPTTDWPTQNFDIGQLDSDFSGLQFQFERYFMGPNTPDESLPASFGPIFPGSGSYHTCSRYLRVEVEARVVDECDYEPERRLVNTEYGRRQGSSALFADGFVARDTTAVGVTSTNTSTYATIAGRLKQINRDEPHGATATTVVSDGAQSGVPAAEICDAEEIAREQIESFTHLVCLAQTDGDGVEVEDGRKTERISSDWVETPAEAEAWGRLELRILHSFIVTTSTAHPIPILDAADTLEIDLPGLGFDARAAKIWETDIVVDGDARTVRQKLTLRVPPVD